MKNVETSENIQSAYDEQYSDKITKWREVGAKYKFQNIKEVLDGRSFKKVLEFGAGEGSILQYMDKQSQFEELFALEISDSGITQIRKRNLSNLKEIKKFDGYHSGYADDEFDLVYCSHVIEHVEHPRLVLREIFRISKCQVFEVPLDYSKTVDLKVKHYLDYGHINIFTPSLFKFLIKSEGFKVESEKFTVISKELLEYNWYQNMSLKPNLIRKLKAILLANKSHLMRFLKGKAVSNEYYHSAYTCFTSKSGVLKIFESK